MGRKKKSSERLEQKTAELATIAYQSKELQEAYIEEIDKNPKYSLTVDPENKYGMTDLQKKFVRYYVDFKNVNTAAELAGIDQDTAKQLFIAYSSQVEIRRINLALYQRQFCNRLLSLDEIGGYLSSLLTDDNVPLADHLKIGEKLKVAQMLIDLNEMKARSLQDPTTIMAQDIDTQIKNLSVETIRQLLTTQSKIEDKNIIVQDVDPDGVLTPEENAYLSTLPTEDLLKLIDSNEKGASQNDNQ